MSIVLHDIPAAVHDYIDKLVTIKVTEVESTTPKHTVLTSGDTGAFTVTAFNGGVPNGIRLINVLYHVSIADVTAGKGAIAKLLVPDVAIGETFADKETTTPLKPGDKRVEFFVRLPDATLGQGDTDELPLTVICVNPGDATITADVHADVDPDSLFPNSESASTDRGLSVL